MRSRDARAERVAGFAAILASLLIGHVGPVLEAQPSQPPQASPTKSDRLESAIAALPLRDRQWIASVRGLITIQEVEVFLGLRSQHRRDAFREAFWQVRDPERRTPRNELKDRFDAYAQSSGGGGAGDPRVLLFLLNGPPGRWNLPDGRGVARCFSRTRELEIWFYGGSEKVVGRRFPVILIQRAQGTAYTVWTLGESLRAAQRSSLPTRDVSLLCGEELLRYAMNEITKLADYDQLLEDILTPPRPSPEWLASFAKGGTDLPEGAQTFEVELKLSFPSRRQSRSGLEALVRIPAAEAPGRRFEEVLFHNFLLTGEVMRGDSLFESFQYRFEGPTSETATAIPLGFTRFFRPGTLTLRLLIEDAYSGRFARIERDIEVPSPDGRPQARRPAQSGSVDRPALSLRIPASAVHVGLVRFGAEAGREFDRVTFYLDDRQVLSKRRPPYSVELNLGEAVAPHRVRVVGWLGDQEAATDQVWLNQGAQRFRVRIVEPRAGGIYPGGVTARMQVETPDGQAPERLELFLNDRPVATVDSPPYAKSLLLEGVETAVLRAVAYLADGSSTEDAVVFNTSDFVEEIAVSLVELAVAVTDTEGRAIEGLGVSDFRVLEDGVAQEIEAVNWAGDRPLVAALVVDRSVSMDPHLSEVVTAATEFARLALSSPEDRVAVLSFAERPTLDVGFTDSTGNVARALAGLRAQGRTALFDGLARGFSAVEGNGRGAGALVVFTDGADEVSQLGYGQILQTASRSPVTLYIIGFSESFSSQEGRKQENRGQEPRDLERRDQERRDREAREQVELLATQTGGRAVFAESVEDLSKVYEGILSELRSRYLVTYTPRAATEGSSSDSSIRAIAVEVEPEGAIVRTRGSRWPR